MCFKKRCFLGSAPTTGGLTFGTPKTAQESGGLTFGTPKTAQESGGLTFGTPKTTQNTTTTTFGTPKTTQHTAGGFTFSSTPTINKEEIKVTFSVIKSEVSYIDFGPQTYCWIIR